MTGKKHIFQGTWFKTIPFVLTLGIANVAHAQSIMDIGTPHIKNYSYKEYKAHGQNFSIVQDQRGLIYAGNFSGVLEFDGSSWRTIPTEKITKVSALAVDKNGRIFVGALEEIGFLEPDSIGRLKYKSLLDKLEKQKAGFKKIIACFSTEEGIFFIGEKNILLWNNNQFKDWQTDEPILSAFYVGDELYFLEKTSGLKFLKKGKITAVEGGEYFSETVLVTSMFPLSNKGILIGSGNKGLFLLNNNKFKEFKTGADEYLMQKNISCGTPLRDGDFALGTERGGLITFRADGSVKQILDNNNGLQDVNVNALYADKNNVLWLALNNGISRFETPSYITFIGEKTGLKGGVNTILKTDDAYYFGTNQGLFCLQNNKLQFDQISGINTFTWSLTSLGNKVIATTSDGVYEISGKTSKLICPGFSLIAHVSEKNKNQLFIGQLDGLIKISNSGGGWSTPVKIQSITNEIKEIVEDSDGVLWLNVTTKGIIKFDPENNTTTLYDMQKGLPSNTGNRLNKIASSLYITSLKGIFQYNKSADLFKPIELFDKDTVSSDNWVSRIVEDKNHCLWVNGGDETHISFKKLEKTGKYTAEITPFLPVSDFVAWTIYPDDNGITWFGGPEGILRYDKKIQKKYDEEFSAIIRSVSIGGDSIIFGGTYFDIQKNPVFVQNEIFKSALGHKFNSIRIEFAAPSFTLKEEMKYQYRLEGFDEEWSEWITESQKDYTNLSPGNYTFQVRAKNAYNTMSKIASYEFTIETPYYKTWWAYSLYIILLIAGVFALVRLRSQQLVKEKKKLESMIVERTAEVVSQKEEIEKQSSELSNKNDELEKINLIVKAINSEVHFGSLLQSILEKTRVIRAVEKGAMLVLDKEAQVFRFKASVGRDIEVLQTISITLKEAEERYLTDAEEIFEDIYSTKLNKAAGKFETLNQLDPSKSLLIMLVRIKNEVEGFLILENMQKENAFDDRDFSLLQNLKEHVISAFIKTTILENLQNTLINLKETQDQLIRQEKLASIGQLTKGIVDRILNPLNYINNFSLLTNDLSVELATIVEKEKEKLPEDLYLDFCDLLKMIEGNVIKINEHGVSASRIVKGMEKLLKEKSTIFVLTNINSLVESHVEIAVQEVKAEYKDFNANVVLKLDEASEKASVLPAEMGAVIINMVNNACYSVYERSKIVKDHKPEIILTTKFEKEEIKIFIRDNGKGIPAAELKQMFSPFFTTKPTSKGTGLGLYMSQDIVKIHKGNILVDSKEGEFTEFTIIIPKQV